MKIALVAAGGLHPSGRDEVVPVLLWLVERLAAAHHVHAFVVRHLPAPSHYPLAGATIHDLGRPRGRWAQWRALASALAAHGPFDIVHGFWGDPAGVLAALAGRRFKIPSLVTCDTGEFTALPDIEYGMQRHLRGRVLVSLACRLATRVHVTSAYMAGRARAHGVDAVRLPLGVDLGRVAEPAARAEGPPWRLLQVATLSRVKDQRTLLHALAIARRRVDARLDLVGEDTLRGRLAREAAALDITGAVSFHGFVPHDELTRFHRQAHAYVQSSRHEACGIAVLEAAAAGVPVVGTAVGHLADLSPEAALAVPPADPPALASAIVSLLENPAKREALADAARRFAVAHDADWSARELTRLYEELAARPARRV